MRRGIFLEYVFVKLLFVPMLYTSDVQSLVGGSMLKIKV